MCLPKRRPAGHTRSPRSVEALHAINFARCIFSVAYRGILSDDILCPACFRNRIPVKRRDLYEIRKEHRIVDGDLFRVPACDYCHEQVAADRPIRVCRPCTETFLRAYSLINGQVTAFADPFVVETDLAAWHWQEFVETHVDRRPSH